MKNIGAFAPLIVIAALIVAAVFGVRIISNPANSSSAQQFASKSLSSIITSPKYLRIEVNTAQSLTVSAVYTQNGSSNGALKTVTNNLTFISQDENIATVSSVGRVTGVNVGVTTVIVSFSEGAVTKTVNVPVETTPVYQR